MTADLKITVIFESECKKRKFLCKPTSSDSLLTSSVMGVIYFPEHRFKLVNRLKSRQGAFKICRDKRDDVKVALVWATGMELKQFTFQHHHSSHVQSNHVHAAAIKYILFLFTLYNKVKLPQRAAVDDGHSPKLPTRGTLKVSATPGISNSHQIVIGQWLKWMCSRTPGRTLVNILSDGRGLLSFHATSLTPEEEKPLQTIVHTPTCLHATITQCVWPRRSFNYGWALGKSTCTLKTIRICAGTMLSFSCRN